MKTTKKLTFGLLPKFIHGRNLRVTAPYAWQQVRKGILEERVCECSICGARPKDESDKRNFHVHESWSYDLENHILILEELELICHMCHQCDHMGLLHQKFLSRQISHEEYDAVFEHYAKVNQCSLEEATKDCQQTFRDYRTTSINHDPRLIRANWTYQLACDFPAKDKVANALRKKGLLTE